MGERLAGRVIAIAGASAGIGLATSTLCAAEGAQVVMLARGKERLEECASKIGAIPVPCDVADPSSVRAAFAEIDRQFGKLNALINVAGVARIRAIEDASDEDINFVFGVNLLGPIFTTRSAVPLLRKAGGGDIINVSSEMTDDYMPKMVLYGASKGGLDSFSKMMVHELKPDKIRVCLYVSGSVNTEFASNFTMEEMEAVFPEWQASGYLDRVAGPGMEPEWMAEAFLFQLTRPAGQMIDRIHVRSFSPGHETATA
ncbi:MAG: short-chain dehydrogenase/reductase [Acidimicrobiia bacterium]|nr:short-chain dehydrogenase/reductase [Acidimicrobiia bacterium]